ncbi:MAG: replicative DNA helicase [Gemmatimonadales bacterium]
MLGAMMLDQNAALRAAELLEPSHFYREGHRRLFRAMARLVQAGTVIDPVTLRDELKRQGELDESGGVEYLAELVDSVTTTTNLEAHTRIIRDKAVVRQLIETANLIATEAYEQRSTANELLDVAESRVFQISQTRHDQGFTRIKEMLSETIERIELLQRSGKTITGVASGFKDLDELTSGFQKSDLVIVAARPSMGKTAFCLNVAAHAAIEEEVGVAVFSLEMSKESLVQRLLAAEAWVDSQKLRRGGLRDTDFTNLAKAAGRLHSCPMWIDDSPALTLLEMRSKARRLKAQNDVGIIIVDYLQLMRSPEKAENRVQEISEISRGLKGLARELETPVIALSQLSRATEQRGGDRRPILSDLRESGAIEQDADLVVFIHRPEMYKTFEDTRAEGLEGKAEVIVGKQRNGPTGTVELYFHKAFTRFDDYTKRQPQEA